jgi:EAL domain-containing protein (putative c-di-GMP-specific phosphodiesterase class I)/ActR/RegA family two-component response regulator
MCQLNTKSILIVDDDSNIREMLSLLLGTRGYTVDVAASASEAINKVSENTDLILLDLILPDFDGFEVCRRLKSNENTSHVPIIMLSARLLSHDVIEGLYLGADDYLTKPFACEELVARMEAVMRRSTRFRNGINSNNKDDAIVSELRKITENSLVIPFFQPIYNFETAQILGFEVLTRPESNSLLANPEFLFKAALQFGFYEDLEIKCWDKAVSYAQKYLTDQKLFLNCNPYIVEGQRFNDIEQIFLENNMSPENIVFEITERSAVSDYKRFYDKLTMYRGKGFMFAIDDVGGGYGSLEAIVATKPEVVKIDHHIIAGIDDDQIKKSIVRFIAAFCNENNILCIAEGIERKEEMETVIGLGVNAGQGYYLCRPKPQIVFELSSEMNSLN